MNVFKLACLLAVTALLFVPQESYGGLDDSATSTTTAVSEPAELDAGGTNDLAGTGKDSSAQLADLIFYLTVFVLAIFVGFEVITKVPPTLHTPLMSGSNAMNF